MRDQIIKKIQKSFTLNKIDALLVSSAVNIQYLSGYSNFSKDEREAYLFITKKSAILFTDNRYIEAVEKIVPENITPVVNRPLEIINQMVSAKGGSASGGKIIRVGVEKNFTVGEYEKLNETLGIPLSPALPLRGREKNAKVKIVITDNIVEQLRSVKDADEIKSIKKAAKLTHSTLVFIKDKIKLGVTEAEIAWEMEKFIRQGGGVVAFDSIVAFGPHSSIPHHLSSDYRLQSTDEFVLLDFGARVDGYCADMTRTFLTKNASDKAKKMYQATLSAQQESLQLINQLIDYEKPIKASEIGKKANDVLEKAGFPPVPHGLGHGIGLEVHEEPHLHPKFDDILVSGNYFSIEPGIYIPGFGGVRIEDDYLITNKGLVQITRSPK